MNKILIKKNEVLRYLGYRNQKLDKTIDKLIDESIDEVDDLIDAKYIYKFFNIIKEDEEILVDGTNLSLLGADIKEHLKDSDSCIIMAVTLGHEVDKKIRYYEKISMTKAMVLDACASTAIEEVCDRINDDLEKLVSKDNKNLTFRYSPGYGDLPINMQSDLLETLGTKKSIGLSVTSHNILIPRKSVTAIIGIVNGEYRKEKSSCLDCQKYDSCNFRKGDDKCGN